VTARSWTVVGSACLANFAVFFIVALTLGGDAINGKAEGGRYFLANHGKLTEVSREIYDYSRYHAISLFITHPIAFLAGWRAKVAQDRSRERSRRAGSQANGADAHGAHLKVSISGAATRYDEVASGCYVLLAGLSQVGLWCERHGHARRAAGRGLTPCC